MPLHKTSTAHTVAFELVLKDGTGFAALGSLHDALDEQPGVRSSVSVRNEKIHISLRLAADDGVDAAHDALTVMREVLEKVGWKAHIRELTLDTSQAT